MNGAILLERVYKCGPVRRCGCARERIPVVLETRRENCINVKRRRFLALGRFRWFGEDEYCVFLVLNEVGA